ncbi:MAG: hypothetical protein KC583_18960 [Myxococcales bacterium]|nr:hypothetical protein [Myxococcales bacterium]
MLALLLVPPLVAIIEQAVLVAGPRHVGFWALARSVAGTCHVPWGRRGSPIVRFSLPQAEGRARVVSLPGHRESVVEVRGYQRASFGFAGRVAAPPTAPSRWRAPGLEPVRIFPEESEQLRGCSLESTDEGLLRWLLRHVETRKRVDGLLAATGATSVEILFVGRVVILRGVAPPGWRAGEAMEHIGPPLVEALRLLSSDLDDLGLALRNLGEAALSALRCPGCAGEVGVDPWICPGCGRPQHRGCREMLQGCAYGDCAQAADALPSPERFEEASVEA